MVTLPGAGSETLAEWRRRGIGRIWKMAPTTLGKKSLFRLIKKPALLFYDNHVLFVWKKKKNRNREIECLGSFIARGHLYWCKKQQGEADIKFFTLFMTSVAETVLLRFFLHEIIFNRKWKLYRHKHGRWGGTCNRRKLENSLTVQNKDQ